MYLREAYHPLFGFLYGWTLFAVIQTGTIAAVAVAFAKFTGVFFPVIAPNQVLFTLGSIGVNTQQILAIVVVWLLTFSNFRNIKSGAFCKTYLRLPKSEPSCL